MSFQIRPHRYSLRMLLASVGVISELLALPVWFEYEGIVLSAIFSGALFGTLYGIVCDRPEGSRWLRSCVTGALLGFATSIFLNSTNRLEFALDSSFIVAVICISLAAIAASATEIFRQLLDWAAKEP